MINLNISNKLFGEYLSELLSESVYVKVIIVEHITLAQTGKNIYFEVEKALQSNETDDIQLI